MDRRDLSLILNHKSAVAPEGVRVKPETSRGRRDTGCSARTGNARNTHGAGGIEGRTIPDSYQVSTSGMPQAVPKDCAFRRWIWPSTSCYGWVIRGFSSELTFSPIPKENVFKALYALRL